MPNTLNKWTSHDEKHLKQLERCLRNIRRGLVRNSTTISNWRFTRPEDADAKEDTLSNNDTVMASIDQLLSDLVLI